MKFCNAVALRCVRWCVVASVFLLLPIGLWAQPVITGYAPPRNTTATAFSADIVLEWSQAMSTATLTNQNIRVWGSQTGLYTTSATFTASGGNTVLTVNPTLSFKPGELITVEVTRGVRSAVGVSATRATVWGFRAATYPTGGQFDRAADVGISQSPYTVALGDVNNDGNLDIVTSNPGAYSVTVRLGNGTGGFSGGSDVSTGLGTFGMALGDVNNDGNLDIIAGNYSDNTLSVRLGDGTGSFANTADITASDSPWTIALGDVNGDGNLDIVAGNSGANTISIFLGNGAGVFSTTSSIGVSYPVTSIELADLNNDGYLDIAATTSSWYEASLFFGSGNGSFSSSGTISLSTTWHSIAIGDVNGDGVLDLAIANALDSTVSILLGNGSGGYGAASTVVVGASPGHIVLGDANGDGYLDMITVDSYGDAVVLKLGNGAGSFGAANRIAVGTSPAIAVVGDMNNDGRLDIAVANTGGDNVSVLLGRPLPPTVLSFTPATNAQNVVSTSDVQVVFSTSMNVSTLTNANIRMMGSQTGLYSTSAVVYNSEDNTAILNSALGFKPGEMITVIVTTGVQSALGVATTRATMWSFVAAVQGGSGVFTSAWEQSSGYIYTVSAALGDLDGDGDLDVFEGSWNRPNAVWKNDGNGNFTKTQDVGSFSTWTQSVALGDVDGDGDLDAFEGNAFDGNKVWKNDGSGNFSNTWTQGSGATSTKSVVFGDVDGDGDLDVFEGNYQQLNKVWSNDGSGNFTNTWTESGFGWNTESLVLGDLDGDGDLDVFEGNYNQNNRVWSNDGSGNFTNTWAQEGGATATWSIAMSDVDGDGDVDVFEGNANQPNKVWKNDGNGNFANTWTQSSGTTNTVSVAFGDIDGDGDVDIFEGNQGQPNKVWKNNGSGSFANTWEQSSGGMETYAVALGDVDGDGDLDVFEGNYNQNKRIWKNADVPVVLSFTPSTNALAVASTASVSVAFNTSMNVSTLTSANIRITGSQTGLYSTSAIVYSSTSNTVMLNPIASFKPGELVTVSATTGTQSSAGVPVTRATVWSFVAAVHGGSGALENTWVQSSGATNTQSIAIGDVDGDGDLDMVEGNWGEPNKVWLNDGSGNFTNTWTESGFGANTGSVVFGDVDGDGDLDMVEGNWGEPNKVWLNDGSGNFTNTWTQSGGATWTSSIAIGDVDGDGDLDMVEGNGNQSNKVWSNDGTGVFTSTWEQSSGATDTRSIALGDVDGDGDLDMVEGNDSYAAVVQNNKVWLNDGSGNFSNTWEQSSGATATTSIALGDVDGDGDVDVFEGNNWGEPNKVWSNAAVPVVESFAPSSNALAVARTASVSVVFNTAMDVGTLTSANIGIAGNQTGLYSTSAVVYNSTNNTVTLTPSAAFKPGEMITVAVTTGVQSVAGAHITRATVWSFVAEVQGGPGTFADAWAQGSATTATVSVVLGDVDGDGDLDVVEGNYGEPNKVWKNDGSGTFTNTWTQSSDETFTTSIALGDVDGDGDLDIFEGNDGEPNKVWLNDGTGTFTNTWTQSSDETFTTSIALGDVDGDGDPDMVEGNYGENNKVWLNDGTGTFTNTWEQSSDETYTVSMAIGDVDGDGDVDIFEGNDGEPNKVWLNDGTGTFTNTWTQSSDETYTASIVVGDVDGDGDLDVFEGNYSEPNKVWLNDGTGTFTNTWEQGNGATSTWSVTMGDLDGDGDVDVFEGNASQPNKVWKNGAVPRVLLVTPSTNALNVVANNDVGIVFSTAMNVPSLTSAAIRLHGSMTGFMEAVAVSPGKSADTLVLNPTLGFKPGELVTASVPAGMESLEGTHTARATVWSFTAQAQGGVGAFGSCLFQSSTSATSTTAVALGDFDNDGDLDVFEGNADGYSNKVWLNDGIGGLAVSWTQPMSAGQYTMNVVVGDVDGDGDLDVFERMSGDSNNVWLNDGTGQFTLGWQGWGIAILANGIALGDVDGDGDLDVFESSEQYSRVLLNDGTGDFSNTGWWLYRPSVQLDRFVVLGDFDNDGDLDIFEGNATDVNTLWANDGNGNFSQQWSDTAATIEPATQVVMAVGDVDGDGDLDVFEGSLSRPAVVWKNDGNGSFSQGWVQNDLLPITDVALADVDGDGDLDVFEGTSSAGNRLYLNDGSGNFTLAWTQNVSTATVSVALGDMDGDGDIDAFTGNASGGANHVWINESLPHLAFVTVPPGLIASGQSLTLAVEVRRANNALYAVPADTTIEVLFSHPFLVSDNNPIRTTLAAGASSTTLTIRVINTSTTTATTTLTVSVLESSILSTTAIVSVGANSAPYINGTNATVFMYENGSTTLSVHIGDVETAATQLSVRATSNQQTVVPDIAITQSSLTQSSSTSADVLFAVTSATNAAGTVVVTATVGDGTYEVTTTITLVVLPVGMAKNLTASALTNAVQLQWLLSTTAGVTVYHVYHGLTSGTLSLLAVLPSTTSSYVHTGLTDGARHYYSIQSVVGNAGHSAMSSEVSAAPNTLRVLYPNGGEVLQAGTQQGLQWQYSGDISSVRIEYSTDNGGLWTPIAQTVTQAGNKPLTTFNQNWTVPNTPTTTALIRVVSLSPTSISDQSDAVFSINNIAPPTNLTATAGSTTISLSWTASTSASVVGYRVLRGTTTSSMSIIDSVGAATTSSTDASANACTTYYYAVQTRVGSYASANSNVANVRIVLPESITVLSPNGGESWQVGVTRTLTWTSTACSVPSNVTLAYSTNNGGSWSTIATVANTGSYAWSVPNTASTQALVRVSGNALTDQSNAVFTIAPIPAPSALAATAGDGSVQLNWTASGAEGLSGYGIWRGTTSGSLSLLTTISTAATMYTDNGVTNCTLSVYGVTAMVNGLHSASSNEAVAVPQITPALALGSPNGGESWQVGVTRTIAWTSTGCSIPSTVVLQYSTNNGGSWSTIATVSNTGSYAWLVPNTPSAQTLVRVNDGTLQDQSDAVFVITAIPAPTGLAATAGDATVQLNWTASGAESLSGYGIWRGTTTGSLSLQTTVSSTATTYTDNSVTNCTLYVYAVSAEVGAFRSLLSTETTATPQLPASLTVLAPNGGEQWRMNLPHVITWTSTGCSVPATVAIELSLNNGGSWTSVTTATENTGSYTWTPYAFAPSTYALVRVVSGALSDQSNAVFELQPRPYPSATATPVATSASYCSGSSIPSMGTSLSLSDDYFSAASLVVSVATSNPALLPTSGITQTSATGATTTFAFAPVAGGAGTANVTFTVRNAVESTVTTTVSVSVVVHALPSVVITGSTSVCAGSGGHTYSVPTEAGGTYTWTVVGGNVTSGAGTRAIEIQWGNKGIGTVGVVVVTASGCARAGSDVAVTLHANPVPSIAVGGATTFCSGSSVVLTAQPSGMSYVWSNGATTHNISATQSGSYSVTVSNEEGCSTQSTSVSVTVHPAVTASATASGSTTLCSGSSVQLVGGGASPVGGLVFAWTPSTGLSNANTANPIATPSATTVYTLTVQDGNGCSSTASVTVTVMLAPVITISSNTTICVGGSTQLLVTGGTSYSWTPSTGLSNAGIANPVATPSATTTYTVTINTDGGCPVQRNVTVAVVAPPVANAGSNVSICYGNSTQLLATGGTSYSWTPSTGLSNATIANPVASPSATTTYTVTVSNAGGCSSTASVTVTVNPVIISATVLLEGAYSGGALQANLQAQGLLPSNQPYNTAPFHYAGTEVLGVTSGTAIVDWVLLDVRSGTGAGSLVERRAALLRSDGAIVGGDGGAVSYPKLNGTSSYYLVVWHRNHVGVMSALPVSANGGCAYLYNFAGSPTAAYTQFADGQKQLATGVYGMAAGDVDNDGIVNAVDRVMVNNTSGQLGYITPDLSLDGIVNAVDRVLARNNVFRVTQVP